MRIALLPSAYAPAVGGVEELTARLADRLITAGDAVEVWTIRHPHDLPAEETIGGIQVRRFALPMPGANPFELVRYPAAARRAFRTVVDAAANFRPDVMHVQCFSANGVYAAAASRRLGIPLVVTLQGETVMDDNDIYERSLAMRLGLRLGFRRADAVTACSAFVLDDAERRFGLGSGTVLPNAIDTDRQEPPVPVELPFERFVVSLGRVVEKKGFDLLLQAFARVAPERPDVGLVIGGDGAARPDLIELARSLELGDRVALPGTLSRGQVAWAMQRAAAFVLPSRVEPFGIVVLEALQAGLPVVVSSRGGASEIVRDGREGIVVDPFDTAALADAIARVLDDDALTARLVEAGRARAGEFGWAEIADRYREVYRTVTDGSNRVS